MLVTKELFILLQCTNQFCNTYDIYLTGCATGLIEKQPKKEVAVAVKALKDEPSKEQKEEFFREVTLMSILSHPNIVQLLAVSTEEEPYGMVFEFMSNGDLNQYLRNALPAETSLDSNEEAKGNNEYCNLHWVYMS